MRYSEKGERLSMPDYKARYDFLIGLPPEERKVVILEEAVGSEKAWLDKLLEWWREDRSTSLPEIREQRKRVQVWVRRLNEAKAKLKKSE